MPLSIELHNSPAQNTHPALAHMAFGTNAPNAIAHPGLQPLAQETAYETWLTAPPQASGQNGDVTWCTDNQVLFGSATVPLNGDATQITHDLYSDIFDCIRANDFPHLLRVWHYLPGINDGAGDQELYKRFCVGRAQAFDRWDGALSPLPAGTAIGARSGNALQIYFLASASPGRQVENPRQLSAFEYPRYYGPRTPQFSRAMVWSQAGTARLLISGTASIVGHESKHEDDLHGQLRETWCNLECLQDRAGAERPLALRVYIRNKADYPDTRRFLSQHLDNDVSVLYLHADICRSELLVEIEGVYDMPTDSDNDSSTTLANATLAKDDCG